MCQARAIPTDQQRLDHEPESKNRFKGASSMRPHNQALRDDINAAAEHS
jgi:hypothetical protein